MDSLFSVVFSNRVEMLFEGFKERLFTSSHPLSKRIVIVPSAAMKSWLTFQMAQDPQLGIAAGVEIGFVEPTLNHLYSLMTQPKAQAEENAEPSELELALGLEWTINEIIRTYADMPISQQVGWSSLLEYLGALDAGKSHLSSRIVKRIGSLTMTLAKLFVDYGRYGGDLLKSWKQDEWQAMLWEKMESFFQCWNYPYRKFETCEIETDFEPQDLQVHVFGLSYIAPLYHRFLLQITKKIPVNYYILSPCQKFWSDLLSDKESVRVKKYWQRKQASVVQQDILEDYLRDTNPLLANFGRLGREMAAQIEQSDQLLEERYALPYSVLASNAYEPLLTPEIFFQKDSGQSLTMLEALQADITLLRNPENSEKIFFDHFDATVQVHAAPKPMREVQVIYDAIMGIIQKHSSDEDPILPGEIVVMASNLSIYEPFIRTTFEASESALDVHIMDLQVPSQNTFIQGFLHLLQMSLGRWDSESLLRLLEYPAFQVRHQLKDDDIDTLYEWIKEAGIYWGKDVKHRNELLRHGHCEKDAIEEDGNGTLEYGLGRFLEGLAMQSVALVDRHEMHNSPIDRIESNQGELLGKFLRLTRSLLEDLKPLIDGTQLSLDEWSIYLKCLCEAYFDSNVDEEINAGYGLLLEHFNAFALVDKKLQEPRYAFHPIRRHLEKALQSQTTVYRESNLQAVRFCSLLPMRAVPAKVVILMGMGDGEFPRSEQALSLNLLNGCEGDYYPTQMDFDRYLFLEALLSARCYFIMSYVSQVAGTPQEQSPSLLVTELLTYISKNFEGPKGPFKECFRKHPLFAFDKKYFTEDSEFKSYLKSCFKASLAHYQSQKNPPHNFLPSFDPQNETLEIRQDPIVELTDLMAFTKNPLKIYLNKALDIYIENEDDRQIKTDEDFILNRLNSHILLKESIHVSTLHLLMQAAKSGHLPGGSFKIPEMDRLALEINLLKANLAEHGIGSADILTIEFNERHHMISRTEKGWLLPPLSVEVPGNGSISIVGRFETVSIEGLIVIAEDAVKEAIKIWPMWLVFCCLVDKHNIPIKRRLIFAKGKKSRVKSALKNPEESLGQFLLYYFKGLQSPSPLLPEYVDPLLAGALDKASEMYKSSPDDSFKPIYDPYLKWLKHTSPASDMESTMEQWQSTAKTLFVDMHQNWYPKKTKKNSMDEADV